MGFPPAPPIEEEQQEEQEEEERKKEKFCERSLLGRGPSLSQVYYILQRHKFSFFLSFVSFSF
jgi:hypothetical protein